MNRNLLIEEFLKKFILEVMENFENFQEFEDVSVLICTLTRQCRMPGAIKAFVHNKDFITFINEGIKSCATGTAPLCLNLVIV